MLLQINCTDIPSL